MPQPAWLVVGPPGAGKSTFIRTEAHRRGVSLLHWNARLDRSLRDGRDRLHIQVRSRETSMLWIEGVEDLTQEAQAFLRRILETATTQVLCVLESTEPWRIAAPVLSRCIYKEVRPWKKPLRSTMETPELDMILGAWNKGEDPVALLRIMLEKPGYLPTDIVLEAYRRWGNGISPWLITAWLCAEKQAMRSSGQSQET